MPNSTRHISKSAPRLFLSRKHLNALYKLVVALLFIGLLAWEFQSREKLPELWRVFVERIHTANPAWMIITLILLPLNWLAETQKWFHFVRHLAPIRYSKAVQSVLAGISFSLFTPNRVGEFGGRVLFLPPEQHWKAIIINLVGNLSQYVVLLTGGSLGFSWFAAHFFEIDRYVGWGLMGVTMTGLTLLYLFYFNIKLIIPLARKVPWLRHFRRFVKDVRTLEQFKQQDLAYLLRWSAIRYTIYSTQYFCLLQYFGIETSIIGGFAGITTIFLLQTGIPLPPISGLAARGSLAVFVWSHFGANEISSLATTFVLWIINLILPALLGTFSLLSVNIAKSIGYDDH